MGDFFVYMIKSAFCLTMFYLFFRLLLSKETFHRFNRIALISLLVLSSVLPAIQTIMLRLEGKPQSISLEDLLLMNQGTAVAEAPTQVSLHWQSILLFIYLVGVIGFLIRQCWVMGQMYRLLRQGTCISDKDGIKLLVYDRELSPFSWMNYIVLSRKDWEENGDAIIAHETAHIHKHHSIDILIVDICIILQWFNPVAWLLKRELQNIHEYEADEEVINKGINAREYQLLLIKKAVGLRRFSMANSFNHTSLKKRITMMCKRKSNPWARLKYVYVLPLAALAVSAFARPEVSNELSEISNSKFSDLAEIVQTVVEKNDVQDLNSANNVQTVALQDTAVFEVVEVPPRFPGGEIELMKFISRNVKYPAEARDKHVQGRVILTFIVEKDGSISNVRVARPVDSSLNAEAIRVVQSMPKWEPAKHRGQAVRVRYTVPIQFRLQGDKDVAPDSKTSDKDVMVVGYDSKKQEKPIVEMQKRLVVRSDIKPLIIIDGKEVTSLDNIDGNDIASMTVIKNPESLKEFGEKGRDGVILITTKAHEKTSSGEDALEVVEEMPEFPGGEIELMKFISRNVKYPDDAKEAGKAGRVIVKFVIDKDGSISDATILRSVYPSIDAEALRVVNAMPKWNPGKVKGEPVKVKYTLPLSFSLS
ncbi:MAG: TonB family protein [Phocaeicola sp.]|nr:TonB family protein [Phocaeicola sp.]